ncbi:urate hydroxylase PuuD [Roseomonas sp. CCTCC AB2023176]|uniref:urate hydroxylase PuuD n=1 Tax=Roseomonas sp. CCTCC AB2023176 TaxID=3342640 RepID=UPI0035DA99BD
MDPILHEWGGLLIRWTHVIAAMAWIGASFYFMHLDASLRRESDQPAGTTGDAWEVHGGGFYHVRKYVVAPERMPEHLIWHKWQAYMTWFSGFALLCWVYYGSADLYLIDPTVRDISALTGAAIGIGALVLGWFAYNLLVQSRLAESEMLLAGVGFAFVVALAWGFQQVFSGRAAMLHTGAVMATWMAGNVLLVIIPNQRVVVRDLIAGRTPDPKYGKTAKIRSMHNNYLTLPVVFFMLANHYPTAWSTPLLPVVVALVLIAGAVIRYFYNERNAGRGSPWWSWGVAAACLLIAAFIGISSSPIGRERLGLAAVMPAAMPLPPGQAAPPQQVVEVVTGRCSMCHAAQPVWTGIHIAPKGVLLDTPEHIARQAEGILIQAVMTHAMPPNNLTGMEPEERRILADWLRRRG